MAPTPCADGSGGCGRKATWYPTDGTQWDEWDLWETQIGPRSKRSRLGLSVFKSSLVHYWPISPIRPIGSHWVPSVERYFYEALFAEPQKGWKMPKLTPSGSRATAMRPTFGTSNGGAQMVPPSSAIRFVSLSADSTVM